jgi:hypothetical protein
MDQNYPPVSDRAKLLSAGEGGAEFREDGDADGHVDRREVLQGTQSSAPQLASGTFVDQRQHNFVGGIPVLSEFNAQQGHMHQAQFNHQGQGQFVHGQVTLWRITKVSTLLKNFHENLRNFSLN